MKSSSGKDFGVITQVMTPCYLVGELYQYCSC